MHHAMCEEAVVQSHALLLNEDSKLTDLLTEMSDLATGESVVLQNGLLLAHLDLVEGQALRKGDNGG